MVDCIKRLLEINEYTNNIFFLIKQAFDLISDFNERQTSWV